MVMVQPCAHIGAARPPWCARVHPAETLALVPEPVLLSGSQRPGDDPSSVEAGVRIQEDPEGSPNPTGLGVLLPTRPMTLLRERPREHQVLGPTPRTRPGEGPSDVLSAVQSGTCSASSRTGCGLRKNPSVGAADAAAGPPKALRGKNTAHGCQPPLGTHLGDGPWSATRAQQRYDQAPELAGLSGQAAFRAGKTRGDTL